MIIDVAADMMGAEVDQEKSSCMMGSGSMMHHGIQQQVGAFFLDMFFLKINPSCILALLTV